MRVLCVATALPGNEPDAVARAFASSWNQSRPTDEIDICLNSDGENVAHVGTGLANVFCHRVGQAEAVERRHGSGPGRIIWISRTDDRALIDLAEAATWNGNGDPRGSSAFLAEDLLWLAEHHVSNVHIHLPALMNHSDLGLGMLSVLSGISFEKNMTDGALKQAVTLARSRLGNMSLYITYPHDQFLHGPDGIGRIWQQCGFDACTAQDFNSTATDIAHRLDRALSQHNLTMSRRQMRHQQVFDGVGGGLGKMFHTLNAKLDLLGQDLTIPTQPADLYVYITNSLELHVPRGLIQVSEYAQRVGAPFVVVTARTQIVRGELPGLGIHGLYRLSDIDLTGITELTVRLAATWGWDA
ncbi:hypothetical protein [Arcanobacterium phocae]|uniref:hypothetical protein n=1 Tax=Arcanobacterium phocae TaxID=131112 RepID=UPI001C0E9058|nr:hypothetical protein [Arcanobacterium phocae]